MSTLKLWAQRVMPLLGAVAAYALLIGDGAKRWN